MISLLLYLLYIFRRGGVRNRRKALAQAALAAENENNNSSDCEKSNFVKNVESHKTDPFSPEKSAKKLQHIQSLKILIKKPESNTTDKESKQYSNIKIREPNVSKKALKLTLKSRNLTENVPKTESKDPKNLQKMMVSNEQDQNDESMPKRSRRRAGRRVQRSIRNRLVHQYQNETDPKIKKELEEKIARIESGRMKPKESYLTTFLFKDYQEKVLHKSKAPSEKLIKIFKRRIRKISQTYYY